MSWVKRDLWQYTAKPYIFRDKSKGGIKKSKFSVKSEAFFLKNLLFTQWILRFFILGSFIKDEWEEGVSKNPDVSRTSFLNEPFEKKFVIKSVLIIEINLFMWGHS